MKKEFLETLGIDKDKIDLIMAENGKDITREQQKFSDYTDTKEALKKANEKIASYGNVDELKADVAKYKAESEAVKLETEKKIRGLELASRVKEYTGSKKFINDLTREAIETKLLENLAKEDSKGKSIEELFNTITEGKNNILLDEKAPKLPSSISLADTPTNSLNGVEAAFAKLNPTLKIT